MQDLGTKFYEERTFAFDYIEINEIIFDDSPDVTLICTIPYFGDYYTATFGLSFGQLSDILRSVNKSDSEEIVHAIAEKLKHDIELPSVVDLMGQFGFPLVVDNCILFTSLIALDDEDDDDFDEEEDEEDEEEEEDDEEGSRASIDGFYAFLVDEIVYKGFVPNQHMN